MSSFQSGTNQQPDDRIITDSELAPCYLAKTNCLAIHEPVLTKWREGFTIPDDSQYVLRKVEGVVSILRSEAEKLDQEGDQPGMEDLPNKTDSSNEQGDHHSAWQSLDSAVALAHNSHDWRPLPGLMRDFLLLKLNDSLRAADQRYHRVADLLSLRPDKVYSSSQ